MIMKRDGLSKEDTICRTKIQLPQDERKSVILEQQNSVNYGKLYEIDTTNDVNYGEVVKSLIKDFKK